MLLSNEKARLKAQFEMPFAGNHEVVQIKGQPENHSYPAIWKKVEVTNKQRNMRFPFLEVNGTMRGTYEIGKPITNMKQHEEVSKDWIVLHSIDNIGMTVNGFYPPTDHPIAAILKGRSKPVVGFMATYRQLDGTRPLIFLELIDPISGGDHYECVVECDVFAHGEWFSNLGHMFKLHHMPSVMAWSSIDSKGYLIPHREPVHPVEEFFLDCEFEDSTKTLLSVGVVHNGKVYYAFDQAAANAVKEKWVIDNVLPILRDVPKSTIMFDLNTTGMTFQSFLYQVLKEETGQTCTHNVIIHVDFPTDVAYIAPLFHLGDGKRIGQMPKLQFHVDYVDPYPTKYMEAARHNAAWDALVLYDHLGYCPL